MDPEAKKKGISIAKSSYVQYENPLHSGNKIIGTYFQNTMALHEAIDKGADEALMMDANGFISEGSGENIFIVKDLKLMTPTKDHCLNGITRQSVIQIAKDLNYDVIEKNLTFDDLISADEAFFTGTAVEITPISKVDNIKIGHDGAGEITKVLQNKFDEVISGKDLNYQNWLTYTK